MSFDSTTIDRIVAGVLTQIGGGEVRREGVSAVPVPATPSPGLVVEIKGRVVTAASLEGIAGSVAGIRVEPKTVITPAAWDVLKTRGWQVHRGPTTTESPAAQRTLDTGHSTLNTTGTLNSQPSTLSSLLIVVHHTDAVTRLWEDLKGTWRREMLGCPDDAAKLAIAELSRGGVSQVVILAEQTHRAACLANRYERVKAVAVSGAAEVQAVKKQLRANVWCVGPVGKSWFELRNLLRVLDARDRPGERRA